MNDENHTNAPAAPLDVELLARCRFCGLQTTLGQFYEFTPYREIGPQYHCRNGRDCIWREQGRLPFDGERL